jgi:hypothetical protein
VTAELSVRLDALRQKRGVSLNQTVLDLLNDAVGLEGVPWTDRYTQSKAADVQRLERALKGLRQVDPRDWT